jgi:hypothetical protein
LPLWTDGTHVVVAASHGVARRGGPKDEVYRFPLVGKFDAPQPAVELFAVLDEAGGRILVRRAGERCRVWNAGDRSTSAVEGPDLHDAVGVGGTLLVAVGDEVRRARLDKNQLELGDPVGVAAGRARLHAGRCGVAVSAGGEVAVLDAALAVRFRVRLPAKLADQVSAAIAVPQGVLVSVAGGTHVLLGEDGEVLAEKSGLGDAPIPALLWSDERALVNGEGAVYALALPNLRAKKHVEGQMVGAASSADGAVHVIAYGDDAARADRWKLVRLEMKGAKAKETELPAPDFHPPAPARRGPVPQRSEGPPALGIVADAATAWSGKVGAEVALKLRVSNRGGKMQGAYVEVAGDAVARGLVAPLDVALDGGPAVALAPRAELPHAALDAGVADPKTTDNPAFELTVRVRCARPGNALLMIRVGPLGAEGTAGSGLQGRGFVVE